MNTLKALGNCCVWQKDALHTPYTQSGAAVGDHFRCLMHDCRIKFAYLCLQLVRLDSLEKNLCTGPMSAFRLPYRACVRAYVRAFACMCDIEGDRYILLQTAGTHYYSAINVYFPVDHYS